MLRAFALAIGQLGDRRFVAVLAKSLALTLVLLVALGAALVLLARWLAGSVLALGDGAGLLAATAAAVAGVLLAWLLFRAVAIAVIGLFGDDIVLAVEARHYPERSRTARMVPFRVGAMMGLASAARALGVNLLLAPLYLLLLATGVGTAIAFLVVNGWLLGRDLWDMVAVRHLPRAAMPAERAAHRTMRFALGTVAAFLLSVPLVNFVAPVVAAAMAAHLFHRARREA